MVSKISDKNLSTPLKHLIKNTRVTKMKDSADTPALNFPANSSSTNSTEFYKYKTGKKLYFKSDNTENYNELFSLSELKEAIKKSHNTAVSPDENHYELIRQLPPICLEYLLTALNDIRKNSKLPELWRLDTIIPVSKLGNNNLYASNYRPIVLTSCPCKTMEQTKGRIPNFIKYLLDRKFRVCIGSIQSNI